MRSDTFDGARKEILFIATAPFTEWHRPPRFRDRDAVFGGAAIGDSDSARRREDSQVVGETEFENRGREARLQGSLEAGRIDDAFPQAELDDLGENREECPG